MKEWPLVLLIGPLYTLLAAGGFGATFVIAVFAGREQRLLAVVSRAEKRLNRGKIVGLMVWGLAIFAATLLIGVTIVKIKILQILGAAILLAGLSLCGLSVVSVGGWLGQKGRASEERVPRTFPGLFLLATAAVTPFVGWIIAILALFAGLGAVAEALLHGEPKPPGDPDPDTEVPG